MLNFETIPTARLSSITGGLDAGGEVKTPTVDVSGHVKTDPPPTAAAEPEKQLRCYTQVAGQAGWLQSSRETLRQQMKLCGPLRP